MSHMKVLKRILIGLGLLIAIALLTALFVRKDYSAEGEIVIDRPLSEVFDYVKHLRNQDNFAVWGKSDSNLKMEYKGTDATEGFTQIWESTDKDVGSGEQEITGITPEHRIDYELRFKEPFESTQDSYIITERVSDGQTRVIWGFEGRLAYPMNLMFLFSNFEEMIRGDLQKGLDKLKSILESQEAKTDNATLRPGAFSVSLNVSDLQESRAFYEKLGFRVFGGSHEANYLIMKNQDALIGLFEGMFEDNMLTFNPGWDQNGDEPDSFDDVRDIQKHLQSHGIQPEKPVEITDSGPASLIITDPDGNTILIDQHR